MGRAPCCDKTKVKRGPWSPEENATLIRYLETQGTGGNRIALPQKAGSCSSPLLTPQHLHRPSHASASSLQKSEQQRRTAKLLHRSFFNTPRFIGLLRVL
ncbi:hypothetical protein ACOSP7_016200 [Xanthoceras sorbifolium]